MSNGYDNGFRPYLVMKRVVRNSSYAIDWAAPNGTTAESSRNASRFGTRAVAQEESNRRGKGWQVIDSRFD